MSSKELNKKKISIAVDGRPLAYGMTGNSRYLSKVLEFFGKWDDRYEILLLSHRNIHPVFSYLQALPSIKTISLESRLPGPIWLHTQFPLLARRMNAKILWGTLQILPIIGKFCPNVVNFHDLNVISAPQTMARWNFYQHKFLVKRTLKVADKIFCLSKNTINDISLFQPFVKEKLALVYPGVESISDSIQMPNESGKWGKFLFTLGTLEPRKNLKTLLNAFLNLKFKNPNYPFSLVIAGRAGWGESANELYYKLKLGEWEKDSVYFIENPDESTLAGLYKNCEAFLFPSIHEGFGLPLLEAMREQKICIASDIPVFSEILDSNQDILVSPLDEGSWVQALEKLANKKISTKIWDSKEWTWKGTAEKIAREIDQCIHS
jgi:glycosyltransferase involved in cell wall biosynthesis